MYPRTLKTTLLKVQRALSLIDKQIYIYVYRSIRFKYVCFFFAKLETFYEAHASSSFKSGSSSTGFASEIDRKFGF